MKFHLTLLLPVLFLCSCNTQGTPVTDAASKANTTATRNGDVNAKTESAKILKYFGRHKSQDVFDTSDATYARWWGLASSSVNSVVAGHLFSNKQIHAVIYYPVEANKATLVVYIKTGGEWKEILRDTAITDDMELSFKDWNHDGIKDLTFKTRRPLGDLFETYAAYLCSNDGSALREVNKFEDLRSPDVDSLTGHIITEDQYHGIETLAEYCFDNDTLKCLQEIIINDQQDKDDGNSACSIRFSRNNKVYKTVATTGADVIRYLLPQFKKRSLYGGDQ